MNQTWENCKKPSFGSDVGPFGRNLGPKILFVDFTSTRCCCKLLLYAISKKKNTWENGKKKLVSGPILDHLAQIWTAKFVFQKSAFKILCRRT